MRLRSGTRIAPRRVEEKKLEFELIVGGEDRKKSRVSEDRCGMERLEEKEAKFTTEEEWSEMFSAMEERDGEARVSEAVDFFAGDGIDSGSMNLRSGTKIARRRVVEEKGRLDLEEGEMAEDGIGKRGFGDGEKDKGKLVVEEDCLSIGGVEEKLNSELVMDGVEEQSRIWDGLLEEANFAAFKPEETCKEEEWLNPYSTMEEREARVSEVVGSYGEDGVNRAPYHSKGAGMESGYMNLWMYSRKRRIDEVNGVGFDHVQKEGGIGRRIYSTEEKGKDKSVVDEDHVLIDEAEVELEADPILVEAVEEHSVARDGTLRRRKTINARPTAYRKEAERKKAIELAPKFAFFKAEEEGEEEEESDYDDADQEKGWPGPFSTAMKIIEEREKMLRARELNSSSKKDEDTKVGIQWMPSKDPKFNPLGKSAPSLNDLCMKVLAQNAEEIESLKGVPDLIKHRLVSLLCGSRKMNSRILGLLVRESPMEIHISDCSWATEEQFEDVLGKLNTNNLKVLQLDLCGRCMSDYLLQATLARSPNSLPSLTKISLKGAYRLSDDGLNAIVASSPLLSSINLSQCSLLTSAGIIGLVDKLESVLKELYIDDCQNVDAMLILPALVKLKYMEVLSVAGIDTVRDKFVKSLISVCGPNLRELVLAGCCKLTATSMKTIGENCSQLRALDLRNLNRLNDSAIGCIANGCRSIQKLKLRRNAFSDEAIAAFVEASGVSLTELSLNNVEKVAEHTAIAISRRCCSTLKSLDLSFCRKMTDEALGLIVDSCSHLRMLKLFGCTQVTGVFLEGHSNPLVKIVGMKGLILEQIEMTDFL